MSKRDPITGQMLKGHTTPPHERVLSRVVVSDVPILGDPCWIFTGAKQPLGYGVVGKGGRGEGNVLAHRATFAALVGDIPEGLELDHLCRTPSCVNPSHLEAVTRHVNIVRGLGPTLTRQRQAAKTHCPRGHAYDEANTYLYRGARHCRACKGMRQAA